MKQSLFSFLFFAIFLNLKSQAYVAFPDSNSVWTVMDTSIIRYFVKGDTSFNSMQYKKYFSSRDSTLNPLSWNYIAMVRQDVPGKKVFARFKNDTNERLLYNFSLAVNQQYTTYCAWFEVNQPVPLRVSYTDTMLIQGNYRKVFNMRHQYNSYNADNITEGIGSASGPFNAGANSYIVFDYNMCHPSLLSVTLIGDTIYGIKGYRWNHWKCKKGGVGLIEQDNKLDVRVFPNPASGSLKIMIDDLNFRNEILVNLYNILGEKLQAKIIDSPEVEIDLSDKCSGT